VAGCSNAWVSYSAKHGCEIAIVLITSIWFGLAHYAFKDFPSKVIVGLVFGSIFALTGRIFMLMIAHATLI
jgi:membrane protease YdiL (CAAX protease family)